MTEVVKERRTRRLANAIARRGGNVRPEARGEKIVRDANEIAAMYPKVVKPTPGKISPWKVVQTDFLKIDLAHASSTAKASPKVGKGTYNTTLRIIDLPRDQQDEMIAAHVDAGYTTLGPMYFRSGRNMANVFGVPDFDYWGEVGRCVELTERIIAAGLRPLWCLQSNDDAWMHWPDQMRRMKPVLDRVLAVGGFIDPTVLFGIETDKVFTFTDAHVVPPGMIAEAVFIDDAIKDIHEQHPGLRVWVHFTGSPYETEHPELGTTYGVINVPRACGIMAQDPWNEFARDKLGLQEWAVEGNKAAQRFGLEYVLLEYNQRPYDDEEHGIRRGKWINEVLPGNNFGCGGVV